MTRFTDRVRAAVNRSTEKFGQTVTVRRADNKELSVRLMRRLPQASEIGDGVGRNVFILYEWICSYDTFEQMKAFFKTIDTAVYGDHEPFANGERIIDEDGAEYLFDRQTPYIPLTGPNAGYRLLTVKIGATT